MHVRPLAVQRLSEHGTAPEPEPSPQQYRFCGLPPWTPLQSAAHETQSSPLPASHLPFPHTAPDVVPPAQSPGHPLQSSPASQIELPLHGGQARHPLLS